jgi:hypothetical protein
MKHALPLAFSALVMVCPAPAFAASDGIPDWKKPPLYETITVASPMDDDPQTVAVDAGGAIALSDKLATGCAGYLNMDQPDVDVDYTPAEKGKAPLVIRAKADMDTMVLVFTPDQQWLCADDRSDDDRNPELVIDKPLAGNYNVWVGTVDPASVADAKLIVSEKPLKSDKKK